MEFNDDLMGIATHDLFEQDGCTYGDELRELADKISEGDSIDLKLSLYSLAKNKSDIPAVVLKRSLAPPASFLRELAKRNLH